MRKVNSTSSVRSIVANRHRWNNLVSSRNDTATMDRRLREYSDPLRTRNTRQLVYNESSTDPIPPGAIVVFKQPMNDPSVTNDLFEFEEQRIVWQVGKATASDYGNFGIMYTEADPEAIGYAYTSGFVTVEDLYVPEHGEWITRARAGADRIEARPEGTAQIMWKGPGTDTTVQALLRLNHPENVAIFGKANTNIQPGPTPAADNVRVWNGDPLADTSYDITASLDWMHGNQQISADKELYAVWVPRETKWRIVGAECEDPPT